MFLQITLESDSQELLSNISDLEMETDMLHDQTLGTLSGSERSVMMAMETKRAVDSILDLVKSLNTSLSDQQRRITSSNASIHTIQAEVASRSSGEFFCYYCCLATASGQVHMW